MAHPSSDSFFQNEGSVKEVVGDGRSAWRPAGKYPLRSAEGYATMCPVNVNRGHDRLMLKVAAVTGGLTVPSACYRVRQYIPRLARRRDHDRGALCAHRRLSAGRRNGAALLGTVGARRALVSGGAHPSLRRHLAPERDDIDALFVRGILEEASGIRFRRRDLSLSGRRFSGKYSTWPTR